MNKQSITCHDKKTAISRKEKEKKSHVQQAENTEQSGANYYVPKMLKSCWFCFVFCCGFGFVFIFLFYFFFKIALLK